MSALATAVVTATDFLSEEKIETRNDHEIQAGIQAFIEASRGRWIARRRGEACGRCNRTFGRGEPVWRRPVSQAGRWFMATLCETCHPHDWAWFGAWPCETCGRPVVNDPSYWEVRQHVFCCHRCEYQWHNQQRNQRARQARERVCPICAQPFVGTRRDATTCSPACRQKAYRLRKGTTA